jgi:hypothetical protein
MRLRWVALSFAMSFAMSIAMSIAMIASVAGGAQAMSFSAGPRGDVFQGTWTSIDLDGSNMTLEIRGSGQEGHHAMYLFDDFTTGACNGAPAHVQGAGVVDGNSLVMTGPLTCMPGGNPLQSPVSLGFQYNPGTDTLTDDSGVTWYRA